MEMRNIQKCNWFIERAAALEAAGVTQYRGWSEQPRPGWGKTEAERLIYGTAIVAWLVPALVVLLRHW